MNLRKESATKIKKLEEQIAATLQNEAENVRKKNANLATK